VKIPPSEPTSQYPWVGVGGGGGGDGLLTVRVFVPVEPENWVSPEYVPETVSVPAGAAEELQEPLPLDKDAVHSCVDPVVNVTDPVGVPVAVDVTVAEYVTEFPTVTGFGPFKTIAVFEGFLTTSVVVPVDTEKLVSPEYAPEIVSLPAGAAVELQEPFPFDAKVAWQSGVDPVVKVTCPDGVNPPTVDVTVAE
jgi:hypothetical protein